MTKAKPWFKYWQTDMPRSIDYPQVPLHEILTKTAREYPKQTALEFLDAQITYEKLSALSDQFAVALTRLGLKRGDRVAIFLPNLPQFVIAYFGVLKAGAVLTAISPLHREREVKYQLCDSEATAIITLNSLYPVVANVWKKTKLKQVIVTSAQEYAAKTTIAASMLYQKTDVYSFQTLIAENTDAKPAQIHLNPQENLAALQYTGGTTGTPKAAMLTHMNLVSNAIAFATWLKSTMTKETFLTALPLFHIYGMTTSMNAPISSAAKMVLLPHFDPLKALELIQKHEVTVFCGVPTMYAILLAHPAFRKFNLTSLRACISGASPLPPQVQKTFMEVTGGFLAEGYGLSEASPVTHCNPVDKTMRTVRVGSIGLPLPNTDACIFDLETGRQHLNAGETGELAVKGPQVMKGYWHSAEETASVLRSGWLFTGDIARMDEDGYFYITDRKKDLIKYKDYSVYPREIEDVLYEHPSVKLCAVVGKPDRIAGEIPKAFVVLRDGASTTEAEIEEFVNGKVAPYKAIREVGFRKELPLSSAGKVLRRVLQEEEKAHGSRRNV